MGRLIIHKKYIAAIILVVLGFFSNAQDKQLKDGYLPNENVYLNVNSDVFLSGESLYYKLYSLLDTNQPSNISKVAYVELLGKDGLSLFKHKLRLEDGIGYGDFFIPSEVVTGQYKIVAYTNWMNNNPNRFYQKDIYILNPYLQYNNFEDDKTINIQIDETREDKLKFENRDIQIETKSKVFKTRSLVSVDLKNSIGGDFYDGNYSLLVRKVDPLKIQNSLNIEKKPQFNNINFQSFPEIRGEIISGIVKSKINDSLVPNIIVTLSIPGKNYIFKNVKTDKNGRFILILSENYKDSKGIIQILDDNKEDFKIILDDKSFKFYSSLTFQKINLNANIKDWLLEKSIYNQIESIYYRFKKDSVIYRKPPPLFYGKASVEYLLDDYTRFPTLKETFVEVVQAAAIRRDDNIFKFKVFNYDELRSNYFNYSESLEPLVLFDGVVIQAGETIIDYNAKNIEKINVVRGIYFNGPSVFNGIIDIRTKNGDFSIPSNGNNILDVSLKEPENKKLYYEPDYKTKTDNLKRIPDYRTQLLWQPNLFLNSNKETLEFYTSDVEGIFEILLDGFTLKGKHIISKQYIEVKK